MATRLEDESAIRALMDRYGAGVDERDWDAWRTIFTDPLATDFSGIDPAFAPATVSLDDHVAGTRAVLEQFNATQHMITNVQVSVSGDSARLRAVMRAEHWMDDLRGAPRFTMFGIYENGLTRSADGWLISALALRVVREEGNTDVWAEALRRAQA